MINVVIDEMSIAKSIHNEEMSCKCAIKYRFIDAQKAMSGVYVLLLSLMQIRKKRKNAYHELDQSKKIKNHGQIKGVHQNENLYRLLSWQKSTSF